MRKRAKEVIGDGVVVEKVALTFPLKDGKGGEEVILKPFGSISDLWKKVTELLEQNERYTVMSNSIFLLSLVMHRHGRLTWHEGRLPEDEIWVKLGGDKGGGTLKMAFQIVNVLHPNATNNTCVFCIFEGPDSVTNLTVMAHRFQQQVNALESMQWK
jgi:hypothetical protein